jgi:hypothetical protein
MAPREDPRAAEARRLPLRDVAERLGIKWRGGRAGEHVGPCPVCGGTDRFAVNPRKGVWLCRRCDLGGDGIALARHVLGLGFREALDWLVGEAPPDPARLAELEAHRAAEAAREAQAAERYRQRAIDQARAWWRAAAPGAGTPAEAYLAARGITFAPGAWPKALRFRPDHPAMKRIDGRLEELHRGPCMLAAIQGPDGRLAAVHQTWIDPARPGEKARLTRRDGTSEKSKFTRGSKKGGAIRLVGSGAGLLVMGEGIETTLSLRAAGLWPGASWWAGVDLGNMSGRQAGRNSGVPDLEDARAFLPPRETRVLVYLQDGDSAPGPTRAHLEAGLRRAMAARPGLRGFVVPADPGADFNDMWRAMRGQDAQ